MIDEDSVEEEVETEGDGHNTPTQTKLGLDIYSEFLHMQISFILGVNFF